MCFWVQVTQNDPAGQIYSISPYASYLDLDWPAEVGHIDIEGDVVVKSEVKLFTGEAVSVLLDIGPGYDGHLFAWDGTSCEKEKTVIEQN